MHITVNSKQTVIQYLIACDSKRGRGGRVQYIKVIPTVQLTRGGGGHVIKVYNGVTTGKN